MSIFSLWGGGFAFPAQRGRFMDKIDPGYLYELGSTVRGLRALKIDKDQPWIAWSLCAGVRDAVSAFIEYSIYAPGLRTSRAYGQRLITEINNLIERMSKLGEEDSIPLDEFAAINVMRAYNAFEPVMIAELQSLPIFLVPPPGGHSTMPIL